MNRFNLLLACMLGLWNCTDKNDTLRGRDIDEALQAEMRRGNIPSLVACVIQGDQIVWRGAYGLANKESGLQASFSTPYPLMSVSKLVIAAAAMQLVERGALDLDADVGDYLPFRVRNVYPGRAAATITARMLLSHTSGITNPPGFFEDFPLDGAPPLNEWLAAYFSQPDHRDLWLDRKPGSAFHYSNTGSALMALIVERLSGMDYNEYCKRNLFQPLEMPNTSHRFADIDPGRVAYPYDTQGKPFAFHYTHRDYPAGWLKSSAEEFSHFLMAFLNKGAYKGRRILRPESVDRLLTVELHARGMCLEWIRFPCPASGQRWLFFRRFNRSDDWYGHNGGDDAGYTTHAAIQPRDKLGIIILANRGETENDPVFPGGRIYNLVYRKANEFR